MARTYPIRYRVQFGEHYKEYPYSLCDELAICSIVRFPDGKGSVAWHTTNGKEGSDMKTSTLYSAWLALAAKLSTCEDMNNSQREVVLNAINSAKSKVEKLT